MSSLKLFFLAAVLAVIFVSNSFGASISVVNASFETAPVGGLPFLCGTGCSFSEDNIPGWVSSTPANSGQFRPGPPATTTYFNSVPDGITVAYSNGGSISQTVAPTVQLGDVYTLLVDVGVRKDFPDPGTVQLVIGGTTFVTAIGILPAPGSGAWATFTATYTGL